MKQEFGELCRKTASATNNLLQLIPVGSLYFYNLPQQHCDLGGLIVSEGEPWRWVDIDLLMFRCDLSNQISSTAEQLVYLLVRRYAMATYIPLLIHGSLVCAVRIYAVPSDISMSNSLDRWRRIRYPVGFSLSLKISRRNWMNLLQFLDFSSENWDNPSMALSNCVIISFLKPSKSHKTTEKSPSTRLSNELSSNEVNFHIQRWINRAVVGRYDSRKKRSGKISNTNTSELLEIYNSIPSPDVSKYYRNSNSELEVAINGLLCDQSVKGVKTKLYPYQIKSVAKMYEKEIQPGNLIAPNYITLVSPTGSQFYFDSGSFWNFPDRYSLPRGGILAENMGLGKTLICLALICFTKYEVSTTPEKYLHYQTRSRNIELKLLGICLNKITEKSLPWKKYSNYLPESVLKLLKDNPGTFKVPLINYDLSGRIQTRHTVYNRRLSSQNIEQEGVTSNTLYQSSTTLILVPDNLFHQWNFELKKHIEQHALNKLFISRQFKTFNKSNHSAYTNMIPAEPKDLILFDLIVCSQSLVEDASVFKKIYWKRLIIDEGHSTSSKNSRLSALCNEMHYERRWAVTGTPTAGLTRLNMDEDDESKINLHKKYSVKSKVNEREDLAKLGSIIGNFLKVGYFSNVKFWTKLVSKPLMNGDYGSDINLSLLLKNIVVRHSLNDIEMDLNLPPLHHKPVFLKPSYHNKLSMNLFVAVLAVNAVSLERTDVDYMFHPANRPQLRRLVANLQRSTFHWTGFKQEDVESLITVINNCLKKEYPKYDVDLLNNSLVAAQKALLNPTWRSISLLHEMNYYIDGLPSRLGKAFAYATWHDTGVLGAPHIGSLQEYFYKNRFSKDNMLEKLDEHSKIFWNSYWQQTTKRNSQKFKHSDVSSDDILHTLSSPKSMRKQSADINGFRGEIRVATPEVENEASFASMRNSTILGTGSAKLSYMTAKLLENQILGLKSIVFFDFEDSAYYLTEALDILGVDYILYATFIKPGQRAANLTDFTNHAEGTALIMDLKLASHGLNIIAATRVYFLSPVWLRSVEAQAIKRAHRIGQTKDVYVETLLLEGTLEEKIYNRRGKEDDETREKKYVVDDMNIQSYILKHEFIDFSKGEAEYAPFNTFSNEFRTPNKAYIDDPSLLLEHSSGYTGSGMRKWNIKVFNNLNLAKLNAIKSQKVRKAFLESEFLRKFVDPNIEESSNKRGLEVGANKEIRKRVRF